MTSIPRCFICGKTVYLNEQLYAEKKVFHKTCFKCTTCKKVLNATSYKSVDLQIYCHTHYQDAFNIHLINKKRLTSGTSFLNLNKDATHTEPEDTNDQSTKGSPNTNNSNNNNNNVVETKVEHNNNNEHNNQSKDNSITNVVEQPKQEETPTPKISPTKEPKLNLPIARNSVGELKNNIVARNSVGEIKPNRGSNEIKSPVKNELDEEIFTRPTTRNRSEIVTENPLLNKKSFNFIS